MSQTTERLNLWSANDFVLARWGFVRFIALRCMFIWCFVSTCKSPSSNSVYKIPCKNYLREIFDDCSLPSHWGFSIKNPTIESEVSWSSLLSFLHFRRTEFTTHNSTWILAYLSAIALKAAAESDTDQTCILFYLNSLYLFWSTSGLKVSTNERRGWIGCFRWGRQCWCASGPFLKPFQRHVLKCDAYITCCMHAHSFKASLIAFLVTSCLNWRHNQDIACM